MRSYAIMLVLLALPTLGTAQQPTQSTENHEKAEQQKKKDQMKHSMSGMNMEMPQTMQMPGDMKHPAQSGNQPAQRETKSIENSEQQQKGQPGIHPGSGSDAQSITHPTYTLQEPENPDFHTGQKGLPAPELLADAIKREPMGLDDFVSMAMRDNPTLAQAQADVRRSQQQGRQAGLYPNPSVGYSGEHIRGGDYGGGEQGAYVQQEIVLGGKLGLRRNIHEQQARADQIGVEEQNYRVKASVQQAFYRALTSQATVLLRQRLLRVALDAVETAHQLANVGQADAPDILQAEVEAEQAKVDFVRAQREYLQHFAELATEAGSHDLQPSPLKGDFEHPPEINAEEQVSEIVGQSPEVKRAEQEVAVAEARLKDARREPIPDLTVRAGEWWSGEVIESSGKAAGPMSFADASIKLPLWNRNQGNVDAAKAEVERARQNVSRTQLYLKSQAEPVAQEYMTSRFEADRYRDELLPRARRAYELYLMKYQQMAEAYPQVLVSQRTLFQLQVDYLHALSQVWNNALALQNYTLSHGLDQPMNTGSQSTTINLPNGGGAQH